MWSGGTLCREEVLDAWEQHPSSATSFPTCLAPLMSPWGVEVLGAAFPKPTGPEVGAWHFLYPPPTPPLTCE